jgi:hypothetical protein
MHARSALVATIALVASACARDIDPRTPTLVQMQQEGHGGWIVVETQTAITEGELISVEPNELRVLDGIELDRIALDGIVKAELFPYVPEGFGVWRALGTLSTISHGVLAVISAPIWLIASSSVNSLESEHMIHTYPDEPWTAFARWARFPQGMPSRLTKQDLIQQVRAPEVTPPPPAPQAVPPDAATPDAPEPDAPSTPPSPTLEPPPDPVAP